MVNYLPASTQVHLRQLLTKLLAIWTSIINDDPTHFLMLYEL